MPERASSPGADVVRALGEASGVLADPTARRLSPAETIELLRRQIAHLLAHRRDWLLGKLYRLDVRERDIRAALAQPGLEPAAALARLVYERQAERLAARRAHASRPIPQSERDAFGDLDW